MPDNQTRFAAAEAARSVGGRTESQALEIHMPLSEVNFNNWQIADIQTSNKGSRSASISEDGKPIVLQLTSVSEPLSTPFGISSFGQEETTRKSLELRCTPELEAFLRRLDEWAKGYLAEHGDRLFKNKPCEYRDCLQQRGDYPSQVRCKLNLAGKISSLLQDAQVSAGLVVEETICVLC